MKNNNNETLKCYNSFSCIGAILIIVFVLGSILWDICFTKPALRQSIEEIRIEVKEIHNEIDKSFRSDSTTVNFADIYKVLQQLINDSTNSDY